ncbi:MAG TPA: hypothetical protein GXX18_05690 [Bacillales bacterium]|nr:hypothetical protein [Bacillales bacterium]
MGMSKIPRYESPYNVIGVIKQTGQKEAPKAYAQIKLLERGKLVTRRIYIR